MTDKVPRGKLVAHLRLTILELPARWNAADRALAHVDEALTTGGETDLVLLPEASLRGYVSPDGDCDLAPFAEPLDGETARACAALAAKHRVHLVAPLVLREGRALHNAMVGYAPETTIDFVYRKRHPWLPETWATRGAEPLPVVALCGLKITIAICYDLHFLPRESADELERADLLLFPSAWVEEPDLRVPRLVRLAQQFGIAIANANWAPGDVRVPGQGGSCVIGAGGRVLATARDGRIDIELVAG